MRGERIRVVIVGDCGKDKGEGIRDKGGNDRKG